MPFRSQAQERYMFWAQKHGKLKPGTADNWAHETPDIKALPDRVGSSVGGSKKAYMRAMNPNKGGLGQ